MTGPRSRRARAAAGRYRDDLSRRSGLTHQLGRAGTQWRRVPPRIRGWTPLVILLVLALTYPYYVDSLPTNIPIILTLPGLHSSVTILIFVMMAVGLNIVVGYAGLLDLGYVAFYAIGAYTAGWLASGQFQQVKLHLGAVGVPSSAAGIHISIWLVLLIAAIVTAVGG